VTEIQFADFIYPGFDQLVSEAAKYRYRTAGEFHVPMVVRTPYGGGIRGGQYHSQSPEALFIQTPGLKVVCPSNPYDAKGLLLEAIRDEDPVLFFEPKRVYRAVKMDVPDAPYTVPLGEAKIVRPGEQVTCVAWGAMLYEAFTAAEEVAKRGVDVEVIDLRTLWPLDVDTIVSSVEKTGRIVVVHHAIPFDPRARVSSTRAPHRSGTARNREVLTDGTARFQAARHWRGRSRRRDRRVVRRGGRHGP